MEHQESSSRVEMFVGTWASTSDNITARVKLNVEGSFHGTLTEARYVVGAKVTVNKLICAFRGSWEIDHDQFTWIYEESVPSLQEMGFQDRDKNRIVSINEEELILEEGNGGLSSYKKDDKNISSYEGAVNSIKSKVREMSLREGKEVPIIDGMFKYCASSILIVLITISLASVLIFSSTARSAISLVNLANGGWPYAGAIVFLFISGFSFVIANHSSIGVLKRKVVTEDFYSTFMFGMFFPLAIIYFFVAGGGINAYEAASANNLDTLVKLSRNGNRFAPQTMLQRGVKPSGLRDEIDYYLAVGLSDLLKEGSDDAKKFLILAYPEIRSKALSAFLSRQNELRNSIEVRLIDKGFIKKAAYYDNDINEAFVQQFIEDTIAVGAARFLLLRDKSRDEKFRLDISLIPTDTYIQNYSSSRLSNPYIANIPSSNWKFRHGNETILEGSYEKKKVSDSQLSLLKFAIYPATSSIRKYFKNAIIAEGYSPPQHLEDEFVRRFGNESIWW